MDTEQWDDERVMAELAVALRPASVPRGVLEAARAVFTWRTVDAELAALAYDSAVSGAHLAGVRGSGVPLRSLTFEAPGLVIEIDVTEDSLVGQVLPPAEGTLQVHEPHGASATVRVDMTGFFRVHPLPATSFRLSYTADGGQRVVTDPVTL